MSSKTESVLKVAVGVAGAATIVWLLRRRYLRASEGSKELATRLHISKLAVYPIKGCKGHAVTSVKVLTEGFEHDREFVLVSPPGEGDTAGIWNFVSQRSQPSMALIEPSMPAPNGSLVVNAPGMPELSIPQPDSSAERRPVVIWNDAAEGLDCGDAAAAWFSKYLGVPGLRLLRHIGERRIDKNFATGTTMFSDGYPVLVVCEASLKEVESSSGLEHAMLRFRPNLVLEGAGAFEEDVAAGVVCGDVRFHFVKPCSRCEVPAVDPLAGARGKDPLRSMRSYRSGRAMQSQRTRQQVHFERNLGKIFFGQNGVPEFPAESSAELAIGDAAEWMT